MAPDAPRGSTELAYYLEKERTDSSAVAWIQLVGPMFLAMAIAIAGFPQLALWGALAVTILLWVRRARRRSIRAFKTYGLTLCLCACSAPQKQAATSPTASPSGQVASKPSLTFDGEEYQMAYVAHRDQATINEYLRAGESLTSWKQMVTVSESRGSVDLMQYVKSYVATIKNRLAIEPEVYTRDNSELLMVSVLVADDRSHTEFTIFRAVIVPNVGIKAFGFSKWMPLQEKVDFSEVVKHKKSWIEQLTTLDVATVTQTAETKP